ncbi:helix-turn-helix domain-containing protein [Domibacillus tundrae]|uniref:helix-turn-helix domain-containing protein n=1 Tax=Domibacillus tundrae TaxID=1587527 RepID=UPI000617BB41|nr:helix-turn-helix transcriptional regulator [Domibacillus tundrae]
MGLIHCNLRVLMAERGLNIQKVKDQTTLSRTTISNLYNNLGSGIQYGTLLELCELLKCQPGDLLTYVDIDANFELLTENPLLDVEEDIHVVDEEGNGIEYVSSMKTELSIRCKLRYEGDTHEINFQAEIKYGINEKKEIESLDVGISPHFEYKLYELKLLPYVEGYISDELDNFLINWGHDSFYGEEIEGISSVSIHHYTLLK